MDPPAATPNLITNLTSMPLDVLLEILSRLPIETLYRCRYVSKSWLQLIDAHFLQTSTVAGFFYNNAEKNMTVYAPAAASKSNTSSYKINPTFWFLPPHRSLVIYCCRNGLILGSVSFRPDGPARDLPVEAERSYIVCNPSTKSWILLPKLACIIKPFLLDFNPRSSPHYRVFSIDTDRRCWIYSSRTRDWCLQDRGAFCTAYLWERERSGCMVAIRDGAAYSIIGGGCGRYWLSRGYKLLTELPVQIEDRREMHLGEVQELGLCLAHLRGVQLRMWSHGGGPADEWVLRHASCVEGLGRGDRRIGGGEKLVAFHPFMKAVFILYERVVYLYHLDGMALEEFCRPRSESILGESIIGEYTVVVFPFVPCLLDVVGDGK